MDELCGQAPIRISGPVGLLAAVPTMLGFHPADSIVLMCMTGEHNAIGPVARVDLPRGRDRNLITYLTGTALTHADRVAIVCFPPRRRRPPILDDLVAELRSAGVGVLSVLVVHAGRVWEAPAPGRLRLTDSLPAPGHQHPTAQALAVANVLTGRAVLADRDQLRASIAGPRGQRRRAAERAVTAVTEGHLTDLPGQVERPRPDRRTTARRGLVAPAVVAPLPDRVNHLIDCALAQVLAGGAVSVDVGAELALACLEAPLRDGVLLRGVFELDRTWLAMLISCATWTTDDLAPGICAVLAVLAYRHGDGGLAQVSVDRCLLAEPKNRLCHLLLDTMAAGLTPDVLDNLLVPPDEDELAELARLLDAKGASALDPARDHDRPGRRGDDAVA